MIIGILRISLDLPGNRSLKEKRRVVRSVKDRLKSRFNVSAAEVDLQDVHRSAVLGIALVATDAAHADSQMQSVARTVQEMAPVAAIDRKIFTHQEV